MYTSRSGRCSSLLLPWIFQWRIQVQNFRLNWETHLL
ncbi:hypothetical protein COLO4_03424 [Corchorus olitorius]|uniref:Uncharacterized protein n=1 Tax=Corchorus olitorius TaxID=93759 RepID=A0A1R3KYK5_9ROSI|nr:hypothetical protein COLO4_03424 [Corchorus olitorius]